MAMKVTVHLVVFTVRDSGLKILLAGGGGTDNGNRTRILGAPLRADESFEDAARRTLAAHLGGNQVFLEQLYCSVDAKTKVREGQAVSVAYYALLPADQAQRVRTGGWRGARSLSILGPTQRRIVEHALRRLRERMERNTAGFHLLAKKFTLPELQEMYEAVLGRSLDKRNFRKKMQSLGVLRALPEWRRTGRKPARLYTVAAAHLEKLEKRENVPAI